MLLRSIEGIVGLLIIALVLLDAFETIVLPRRVQRRYRLTRLFYLGTWNPWRKLTGLISTPKRRDNFLSYFGPLSLILLLVTWALLLVGGFGMLHYANWSQFKGVVDGTDHDFFTLLYYSATTFFTLGYGDITPQDHTGRFLSSAEAGLGFGFLALVIGYLPVIYNSFSAREIAITLLDSRAGSPPTAGELFKRMGGCCRHQEELDDFFEQWERWAAELLESHLSYPVLTFFRSQHDNQSWMAAITAVLDASAVLMSGVEGINSHQAKLTFAMARHALVDLSQIIHAVPVKDGERLPEEDYRQLARLMQDSGYHLDTSLEARQRLKELRDMYEPFLIGMANRLAFTLPPFVRHTETKDNWRTSAWDRISAAQNAALAHADDDDHY